MKNYSVMTMSALAICAMIIPLPAQGPRGKGRGGQNQPQGVNQAQGLNQAQGFNQAQNQPNFQQLAQTMLATYDVDGNGQLNAAELQTALAALGQMMRQGQQQAAGQNNAAQAAAQAAAAAAGNVDVPPHGHGNFRGGSAGGRRPN